MPKAKRVVILSLGDTHCGMRNGLIAPGTELDYGVGSETETATPELSDWSKWLWDEVWMPSVETVIDFAAGDPLVVSHSGDFVHGSKHVSTESLYSPHIPHQIKIAKMAMEPLRKAKTLAAFLIAFGTESHDYGANSAAIEIARSFGNWGWLAKADHHFKYMIDGFCLDLSHDGPRVSMIPHLRSNSARRYGEDKIRDAVDYGVRYSQLYQRGHVHLRAFAPVSYRIGMEMHRMNVMVTPPMCGPNRYARQAARSQDYTECGVYLWEIIDGKICEVKPLMYRKDNRSTHLMPEKVIYFNRKQK